MPSTAACETLTRTTTRPCELLALALGKPRFDADAVERVRGQLLAGLAYAARDPERVASEQWAPWPFPAIPMAGRPTARRPRSKITREDLARL